MPTYVVVGLRYKYLKFVPFLPFSVKLTGTQDMDKIFNQDDFAPASQLGNSIT
jgi:hypothetical protein